MVVGTSSDAGKSALVAGVCRWLRRRGVRVAPFKAQNMSNNSVVTTDGGEIGRAQAMQARACGLEPSVAFNPVLLKPATDHTAQVVLKGRAVGQVTARSYRDRAEVLREIVVGELGALRAAFDVVICEGAGSAAEINLRPTDVANMALATAAELPAVLVGDIDRGGLLAHLLGTVAALDPEDQARIGGFVVNKFRGDPTILAPGLSQLRTLTGRSTLGVVPWTPGVWIDAEDSLSTSSGDGIGPAAAPRGSMWLRVAVVRFPRISNSTDVDAVACEPGVLARYVSTPSGLVDADVVILPGTKATVADLDWMRRSGVAAAVVEHAGTGRPVFGICGGYQMMGKRIVDPTGVEAAGGSVVDGLGLLDLEIEFERDKHLATPVGVALGHPVRGYEIHHGRVVRSSDPQLITDVAEGSDAGCVAGTHWHGLLENDGFRRELLARWAEQSGRTGFVADSGTSFAAERERQLDLLGDLVEAHLDTAALENLICRGTPAMPVVRTRLE
ncbi:cobyric acid synthase [Pseudonocardia endophytica]|nr:cobyric acid synthase [Pseudonocardia endophytica]